MLSRLGLMTSRYATTALTRSVLGASEQPTLQLHTSTVVGQMKGEVYQKQPVKMVMEKGKTYNWCACGLSKKQPFCDGSHKNSPKGLTPITFKPDATKEYFLCNCKQTNQRPFCDGSHKK